jgi:predicted transcriptional regulator
MVLKKLVSEDDKETYVQDSLVFNNPKNIKPLVSELAWKILNTMKEEPLYPLQIAKKLEVHEQKVYYHINNLVKAGLIRVVKEQDIKGANAKFYSPVAFVFSVDLGFGKSIVQTSNVTNSKCLDFFKEYNKNGFFNGLIVVGSPEAHGPLQSWARDGHYSNFVSFFLGNFIKFSNEQFVDLDIKINAKEKFDENFILIGGPGVNVITFKFNKHLPVKFETEFVGEAPTASFGRGFVSTKTKKEYTNANIGVIQKIPNPFDKSKSIIVLAGITKRGTISAILALTRENSKVLKDYDKDKSFSRVVEGHDLSGDGVIDSIEVLE